jgi:hypothetical protein
VPKEHPQGTERGFGGGLGDNRLRLETLGAREHALLHYAGEVVCMCSHIPIAVLGWVPINGTTLSGVTRRTDARIEPDVQTPGHFR